MTSPVRARALPQCSACLRSYAWSTLPESNPSASTSLRQQVRGKKKLPNFSATVTVKLNQDVKSFGRKGSIVPVERGRMRNQFFPKGIASYVTLPQLKAIKTNGIAIERDFTFGVAEDAIARNMDALSGNDGMVDSPVTSRTGPKIEKISAERSVELIDIFVRPHLDFYRQPIVEEEEEQTAPEEKARSASSAAADLLAARAHAAKIRSEALKPRSIYGSVSTHDVLVAIRAAMATNEEAAKVIFTESDLEFVELPTQGDNEPGRVKQVGEFTVEIRVKGAPNALRRAVRVIAQES